MGTQLQTVLLAPFETLTGGKMNVQTAGAIADPVAAAMVRSSIMISVCCSHAFLWYRYERLSSAKAHADAALRNNETMFAIRLLNIFIVQARTLMETLEEESAMDEPGHLVCMLN